MKNQIKLIFPNEFGFDLERAQTSEHCYILSIERYNTFCLQAVWPDKICQAKQPEALQDYSLI